MLKDEVVAQRKDQPWFRRLYLPAYRMSEAARYSDTKIQTLSSWHRRADPVLPGREAGRPLSYLELVEAAFVAFFRRMGVKMPRIRAARAFVAQNLGAEFPFTEYQFKTEGSRILMELEQFEPSGFDHIIVADAWGQLAWADLFEQKFAEFEYDYELALRWYPAGKDSPVVIDPRIAFGAPMVKGLPTWVLKGRWNAGETLEEIVEDFSIPREAAIQGLEFEGISAAA